MMREIKFRGKGKYNREWIYGSLVKTIRVGIKCHILPLESNIYDDTKMYDSLIEVIPKTISQSTGLKDKKGKEIYEGDILTSDHGIHKRAVEWNPRECRFNAVEYGVNTVEVIGNIHDNPELLTEN